MEILGHYEHLIETNEWLKKSREEIDILIGRIRNDGVAEPTIIELESEIEYILSQWKAAIIDLFKEECKNDELKERLNQIYGCANEGL